MLGGLDARRLLSANSGWFLIFFATDTHGLAQTLITVDEQNGLIIHWPRTFADNRKRLFLYFFDRLDRRKPTVAIAKWQFCVHIIESRSNFIKALYVGWAVCQNRDRSCILCFVHP